MISRMAPLTRAVLARMRPKEASGGVHEGAEGADAGGLAGGGQSRIDRAKHHQHQQGGVPDVGKAGEALAPAEALLDAGRFLGLQTHPDKDVERQRQGQYHPGDDTADEQVGHRYAGHGAIDDEGHTGRDQHRQGAGADHRTGGQRAAVAALEHLRYGDRTDRGDAGQAHPGHRAEHRRGTHRGDRQATPEPVQPPHRRLEQVAAHRRSTEQVAHQYEQRQGDQFEGIELAKQR